MVYVDNMNTPARVGRLNAVWCHMFAYPFDDKKAILELHVLARKIGLKREWFQDRDGFPHYDVTKQKRKAAVEAGAMEIDIKGLVELRKKARHGCKQAEETA